MTKKKTFTLFYDVRHVSIRVICHLNNKSLLNSMDFFINILPTIKYQPVNFFILAFISRFKDSSCFISLLKYFEQTIQHDEIHNFFFFIEISMDFSSMIDWFSLVQPYVIIGWII